MKHILIILYLLLQTYPLFGKETGILYQYKISSGFVFKNIGNNKFQRKNKGEIKNGEPNGQGTETLPNGQLVGEYKDGKP